MTSLRILFAAVLALWFPSAAAAAGRCTIAQSGVTVPQAIGGTGRTATLHWPRGFVSGTPAPLVILLHGSGGSGAAFLAQTKLAETADAHGFIVAAPDGGMAADRGGWFWNIPGVVTVAGTLPPADAPDDVAYLRSLADWLVAEGCVDTARVYASGLSGGGRMTSWLGCVAADRFAAIAPVVGLRAGRPLASDPQRPDPATCRPSRAMPVIAFAGDADTTNPVGGGGASYWQYPMSAALARWAVLDRCTASEARRVDGKVYEQRYTGCMGGSEVVARVTEGGGHSWVVDNDTLWTFLARYRR